jgi:DNA-binding response OmpR family regulator
MMKGISGITVLVVEDDDATRHFTVNCLKKAGFAITEAADGETALRLAKEKKHEVIVLDIMMPGMDGFEVCKELHRSEISSIIIMLTAKTEDVDKIHGLDIGADDYMVKPFNPKELVARIKAIFRRWQRINKPEDQLSYRDVSIDYKNLLAYKAGAEIDLTRREITLLSMFLQNQGKVLSRDDLYNSIYGENHFGTQKVIDVYVKRLREKVEDDTHNPMIIKTVWGKGYVCGEYAE